MDTLLQFVNLALLIGCQHLTQFQCLNAENQVEKKRNFDLAWKTEELPPVLSPAFQPDENGSHDIKPISAPRHNNENVKVKDESGLGTIQSMPEFDLLHNTSKKLVRVKRFHHSRGSSDSGGGGSDGHGESSGGGFRGVSYTLPPTILTAEERRKWELKVKKRLANRLVTAKPGTHHRRRGSSVQNLAVTTLILASVFIAFLF